MPTDEKLSSAGILVDASPDGDEWIPETDDPSGTPVTKKTTANYILGAGLDALLGQLAFSAETELTIAAGAITATQSLHTVDTESDAASDDLDTISGLSDGELVVLRPASDARTVVVKHGTGNILCIGNADFTLDDAHDFVLGIYIGALSKVICMFGGGGGAGVEVWQDADESWTYASVDDPIGVITVPSDATTKYSEGMRIRFVNATNTIYGIIVAVSATTITFLHEIDPTDGLALTLMANSAITVPYFSNAKAPFGFPLEGEKWTVFLEDNSSRSQASPSAATWYNLGSLSLDVPIGNWLLGYFVIGEIVKSATGGPYLEVTLSTANNSESDDEFTSIGQFSLSGVTSFDVWGTYHKAKFVSLASKTTYYLNFLTTTASVNSLNAEGDNAPTFIRATCAYL